MAKNRRLIVCCDGTWKSEDRGSPTNIWKLYGLLADEPEQRAFYQPGVGTEPSQSWLRRTISRVGGGGFGWGLDANILDIYGWLIREYEPGDELWLFGFSRGAYTARSTAGLIRNCGLLRREHENQIDRALKLYRARDPSAHPDAPQSRSFRRNFSHKLDETTIMFLGLWDTVGALGVPSSLGAVARWWNRRYQFHDLALSSWVQHAYHALAIDEWRPSFTPTLWKAQDKEDFDRLAGRKTVEQVWFVGVHSDIGGGYEEAGLSDVTLSWLIAKARQRGLRFDEKRVTAEVKPNPRSALHDSRWWMHRVPGVSRARTIEPGHRQSIHHTAKQRLEDDPGYAPANLVEALSAGMPVAPPDNKSSPARKRAKRNQE